MAESKNHPPGETGMRAPAEWPERLVTADVVQVWATITRVAGGRVEEPDQERMIAWQKGEGNRLRLVFVATKLPDGRWLVKHHPSFGRVRTWIESRALARTPSAARLSPVTIR